MFSDLHIINHYNKLMIYHQNNSLYHNNLCNRTISFCVMSFWTNLFVLHLFQTKSYLYNLILLRIMRNFNIYLKCSHITLVNIYQKI